MGNGEDLGSFKVFIYVTTLINLQLLSLNLSDKENCQPIKNQGL